MVSSGQLRAIEWVLRMGASATFFGHGFFAFVVKPNWINYLLTVGFTYEQAVWLMPYIGILDFVVASFLLLKPYRLVLFWAIFWALATASIRPISGEPIWEFVERGANWAAPLALLLLRSKQ